MEMLYCESCQRMFEAGDVADCPACMEKLRPIKENDPVLLVSVPEMQADFIEPALEDAGIPYSRVGDLGAGFTMSAGNVLETYRFYVPYGVYGKAHDLVASTFGENPLVQDGLV